MRLKEYRAKMGLTQRELLDMIIDVSPGLDLPTLSKIENGAGDLSPEAWGVLLAGRDISLLQHTLDERNGREGISYRPAENQALKSSFSARLLEVVSQASEDRPATKELLKALLGCSEREVRKTVEELRQSGYRIVSTSRTKGYWLARSASEYARLRVDMMSRAMAILRTVSAMDAVLPGQLSIEMPEGRDE